MGKAFALTKEEVLKIPGMLHKMFLNFKETGNIITLIYFIIELFEFVAILSVNNYVVRNKEKEDEGKVGSYGSIISYLSNKTGVLRSAANTLYSFLKAMSSLRHELTHDLDKFDSFEKDIHEFLHAFDFVEYNNLFIVIEVSDINVSGISLDELRVDIKWLLNWNRKYLFDKKKQKNNYITQLLKESAATSSNTSSTLDAIADIRKKYDF